MGYMRHHAIIVTSWDEKKTPIWHAEAVKFFGELVSPIIPSVINGYESFFIAPDGSKEGWDDSIDGDKKRDGFIVYLRTQEWPEWIEVEYQGDGGKSKVKREAKRG